MQKKRLTLDDIYHPDRKLNFDGSPLPDVIWIDNEHFVRRQSERKTQFTEWTRVHAVSGEAAPLYDAGLMETALERLPGMSQDDARRLAHLPAYILDPAKEAVLLNHANDLFYYRFGSASVIRLTATLAAEFAEQFSPDGKRVSFVREHNLYVVDIETRQEWALTGDGGARTLNGQLDWVYQEEIYGRGNFTGYWWSPDSRRIAYLRLDESLLKEYPVTDYVPFHPAVEVTHYPLAGDPNPRAALGVVSALGGATAWMDTSRYGGSDFLIVRVGWTADSGQVVFQVQDREQRWLDLNLGATTLLREQGDAWTGVSGEPRWLQDGSFLWLSERTGWKHLYHCTAGGELIRQVTDGEWEVRALLGADEANGTIFFSGTRDSHIAQQTYQVRLDGSQLRRLTAAPGTHRSLFNPGFTHFVDYRSDLGTPPQARLHSADGSELSLVDENRADALAGYALGSCQLLQISNRDGFAMEALLIQPPDFDPSRTYPVMACVYGGPHHPQVADAWGGEKYMWHQMLAQMGYIVWVCDNRTASGKGVASSWPAYRNLGQLELRDLEDGVAWLKSQPFVAADRIGIWGWSYGGFVTAFALTHSAAFKIGIAGAAVTDWRNYDSVYTERFMGTPQNNPQGYAASSVVQAAANLQGRILLIHGAIDDNVHLQNTIQLADALQKAGKPFELMIYPRSRHSVTEALPLLHLRSLMTNFIVNNL